MFQRFLQIAGLKFQQSAAAPDWRVLVEYRYHKSCLGVIMTVAHFTAHNRLLPLVPSLRAAEAKHPKSPHTPSWFYTWCSVPVWFALHFRALESREQKSHLNGQDEVLDGLINPAATTWGFPPKHHMYLKVCGLHHQHYFSIILQFCFLFFMKVVLP